MTLSLLQGDRGLQGERGMKGIKGDMGDPGAPGEGVSKTELILHLFKLTIKRPMLGLIEDMHWPVVVEIRMFHHSYKSFYS